MSAGAFQHQLMRPPEFRPRREEAAAAGPVPLPAPPSLKLLPCVWTAVEIQRVHDQVIADRASDLMTIS